MTQPISRHPKSCYYLACSALASESKSISGRDVFHFPRFCLPLFPAFMSIRSIPSLTLLRRCQNKHRSGREPEPVKSDWVICRRPLLASACDVTHPIFPLPPQGQWLVSHPNIPLLGPPKSPQNALKAFGTALVYKIPI